MKKLNLLKNIIDFLWIISVIGIPIALFSIPAIFFIHDVSQIPFKVIGQEIKPINFPIRMLIIFMLLASLILFYCIYLFKKILHYFQQLNFFDAFVYLTMNKLGLLIIIFAFLHTLPSFIYELLYSNKIKVVFGYTSFLLVFALGLFFMVLSEVFKKAGQLKQENDLTI